MLVVIGILIAFSINNWNENNKTRQFEITILENIQEDILDDKLDHEANVSLQLLLITSQITPAF